MEKIIIIGASHAGVQLAASLRDAKYSGEITLLGDENITPYHRPPLSKAWLKGDASELQILKPLQFFEDRDIEFLNQHHVNSIDAENQLVSLDNGSSIAYSKLCIATGARPRQLAITGIEGEGVYEMRSALDATKLRDVASGGKTIAVLGGGFIGLEAASSLKSMGNKVSVFEAAPRLMGRAVAPEISAHVLERYSDFGIDVHLNQMCNEICRKNNQVVGIKTAELEFDADIVLVGVGVVPNQELADQAGIECKNGIMVDALMKTSNPHIYAIGDVASYHHWISDSMLRLESVQNAVDQAKHLAAVLTGEIQAYHNVPWFWSDQIDMKLQMAGLNQTADTTILRKYDTENKISVFHFDQEKLVALDTINAPGDHMAARKLIAGDVPLTHAQAKDPDFALKSLL